MLKSPSRLNFAKHLFVASPLEPIGEEGLHKLIQDLTGDQQGGQTLAEVKGQMKDKFIDISYKADSEIKEIYLSME